MHQSDFWRAYRVQFETLRCQCDAPISEQPYLWENNNWLAYTDPSGYCNQGDTAVGTWKPSDSYIRANIWVYLNHISRDRYRGHCAYGG